MRAALLRVDVVDEAVNILLIAVIVLHGNLDDGIVLDPVEVNRLLIDRLLLAVEMGDKGADAAVKVERLAALRFAPLIRKGDGDAVVEERQFAQTVFQCLEAVRGDGKNLGIRDKMHARSRRLAGADLVQLFCRDPAGKGNVIDVSIAAHLDLHRGGEGIDDRNADAVEAAGDLVTVSAELAARMEDGQHDLHGGHAALVHIDGNAAPVVRDSDTVIPMNDDLNAVAVARERLVDGVVHDFIDEVMQAALRGRADIHTGPFAHGLKALKHLNLSRAIVRIDCGDLIPHLLRADGNTREIGNIRHLCGLPCLLRRHHTNLFLSLCCTSVDFLCHYFLLWGLILLYEI